MPDRTIPDRPNLEQYKKQAKELLRDAASGSPGDVRTAALARIRKHHPRLRDLSESTPISLADAQLVLAREHNFESWSKFAHHIETLRIIRSLEDVTDPVNTFIEFACVPIHGWHASGTLEHAELILARHPHVAAEAAAAGATLDCGPEWLGYYFASGGAKVIDDLLTAGRGLPRAIVCANDLTALGVMSALRRHGIGVPGQVAVTGFDDIPLARHLRTSLTTVRQPIRELGTAAFDVLYSMLNREHLPARDIVLPTELIRRESCGCPAPADRADIGWYRDV